MTPNETAASRFPLCAVQHRHAIGCASSAVDPAWESGCTIALATEARPQKKGQAGTRLASDRREGQLSPWRRNTNVDGTGDILRPILAAWNPPEELRQIRAIATGKKATTSRIDGHDRLGPSKTEIALSGRVNDREPLRRSAAAASLPGSSELHRKTHRCMRASIRTRPPAGSPLPGLR